MGPLDILRTRGLESIGRYYGTYRALVLNNEDDQNQGRILVHIPYVQTGIKAWAYPKSIGGGLGYGFKYLMPPKGEFVWIEFEYGDPARPVWSYHPWAQGEMPEELKSPNVIGLVTPKGHYITLNEAAEEDEDILTIQLEEGMSIKAGLEKFSLEIPEGVTVIYSKEEGTKVTIQDGSTLEITKDEILFNGGDNKGLVKLDELKDNLKQLQDYVKKLTTETATALAPLAALDGGASVTKFTANMATQIISFKDMENTKIKQ